MLAGGCCVTESGESDRDEMKLGLNCFFKPLTFVPFSSGSDLHDIHSCCCCFSC